MKHANAETLGRLERLLVELRALPTLIERKPGIFYRRSSAFLHFHEDSSGVFADVKLDGKTFERFAVNSVAEQNGLMKAVKGSARP
jgi:hypothetical protein